MVYFSLYRFHYLVGENELFHYLSFVANLFGVGVFKYFGPAAKK